MTVPEIIHLAPCMSCGADIDQPCIKRLTGTPIERVHIFRHYLARQIRETSKGTNP